MAAAMLAADTNPSEATRNITSRMTKGGRRLHYELTCLQQPERARACGSGQKSAADRRPVDPPPVVQLRVFEGPTLEEAKDITLGYNANFFVYVDLELARPIANGRVQTPAATSPPVLTGAPVSGMAYLDRPAEAGYFLFPDLSVRHEGRYVLGFSLYEELKDDADQDIEPDVDNPTPSFHCRTRVVSAPFVVFSAKKFPGLTSSTTLSRTISEQGCRVRIRRDVRMRRRDNKPAGGADYDKDDEAARNGRARTPDIRKEYRDRSISNSSEHRTPYAPVAERRPSDVDSYPPPPPPPGPPLAPNSHMRYGSDASSTGYGSHYIQPAPQPPPISPTSAYHSSQPSPYSTAPSYSYSSRAPVQPYSPAPTSTPSISTPRDVYDRRLSGAGPVPPSPSTYAPPPKEPEYRREVEYKSEPEYPRVPEPKRETPSSYPPLAPVQAAHTSGPIRLPPIETTPRPGQLPGPSTFGPSSSVSSASMYPLPPSHLRGEVIEPGAPEPAMPEASVRAGSKRAFNDTFADHTRSLYDGQRPQDVHHPIGRHAHYYDPDQSDQMVYPRADGQIAIKHANHFFMS